MNLFDRFATLAKADAHGMLDSFEDRSLVLKQCMRDAELELAQKQMRRDELVNWLELGVRQRQQLQERTAALDDDIRLALERAEEALARFSIRRLLTTRRQLELNMQQEQDAREELGRLTRKLEAQERELQELRDRVEAQLARELALERSPAAACGADPSDATRSEAVREEEVELELLRRREQRENEEVSA